MSVLNVFLIGTGHTQEEEFNLLVVLHDLVDATPVKTNSEYRIVSNISSASFSGDVKIVFDGPGTLDLPGDAGPKMETVRDEVVRLARRIQVSAGEQRIVNLVGHSRGAITAIFVANELADQGLVDACNLLLIDPVKRARIPDDKANILPEITQECIVMVMEDDDFLGGFKPPGMTGHAFKLEKLTRADGGDIQYIRLPGTHGTATQCNPITAYGENVEEIRREGLTPNLRARIILRKVLWPIGGFALRRALLQLLEWGTSLNLRTSAVTDAIKNRLSKALLKDYFAMNHHNPFFTGQTFSKGGRFKRRVNDIDRSTGGRPQSGRYRHGYRTDDFLEDEVGVSANPWRFTPLFQNPDHVRLFREAFASNFPVLINELTRTRPGSVGEKQLVIGDETETELRAIMSAQLSQLKTDNTEYIIFLGSKNLKIKN